MEISDVRVRLVKESTDRLKAVCSVTLDGEFVVRDVKIVEGTHGLFVAMPSRKLSSPCPRCKTQNQLRAKFCNECGSKLPAARIPADADGREKAHRDIAHPITATFRKTIQDRVLESYRAECEKDAGTGNAETAERAGYSESAVETSLDAEEGLGEYDALIADLNDSGSHEVLRDDRAAPPRRDEPVAESNRDQPRHRRGRRRRRGRGEMHGTEALRGEPAAASTAGGAAARESDGERASGGTGEERVREAHAAYPAEERRESSSPGPSVDSPTGARREESESREEESPFGAGLA